MTLNRQFQFACGHPAAIVADPDQIAPTTGQCHFDGGSTGIERVLDKLLHHRSRPLDDFTGGNAVDGVF